MPPVTATRRRGRPAANRASVGDALTRLRPSLPYAAAALLGLVLMVASLALATAVHRNVDRAVQASFGRAAFRVSAADGGTLVEDTLATITSVLGVEVAAPSVERPGSLVPPEEADDPGDAALVPGALRPVTLLGVDPLVENEARDPALVAGAPLTRRGEPAALIGERLAAEDGYGLGSDILVATDGEPERFRVAGIVAGDGPPIGSGGRVVVLPIDALSRLFDLTGPARVDLVVAPDIPLDGVRAELGEALAGAPVDVTSPQDVAMSWAAPLGAIGVRAAIVGVLGLAVGAAIAVGAVWLAGAGRTAVTPGRALLLAALGSAAVAVAAAVAGFDVRGVIGDAAGGLPWDLVRAVEGSFVLLVVVAAAVAAMLAIGQRLPALTAWVARASAPAAPRLGRSRSDGPRLIDSRRKVDGSERGPRREGT
jgi:hypothetical protein